METLRDLRKQAGLSVKEVAEKLGVCTHAVTYYERGQRQIKIDQVLVLAELYDCTEREIILAALHIGQAE